MNIGELQEHFGKCIFLEKQKDYDKALRMLDSLLLQEPQFIPGWNQRAGLLEKLGASFDAVLNYTRAIDLNPKEASLYGNRGVSYLHMDAFDLALDDFDHALALNPNLAEVHDNRGILFRRRGQIHEAMECYREAIACKNDYVDAHLGLSMCLLELQQWDEGWKEFEWRWQHESLIPRGLPHRVWQGERAKQGEALLLCGEQGFGDVLQFIRYASAIKDVWRGRVYAEVRLAVARVAKIVPGIDDVIVLGQKVPDDVVAHICMLSVPAIVGTEKGFIGPYIKPEHELIAYFGGLLKALPAGMRVGLCWAGQNRIENPTASAIDARRSLTLKQLEPLASVKGVVWVSLQKGDPAEQVKMPPVGMTIANCADDLQDFYDTAALIGNCDLVISVDTAVAHLAAAMGKPTWMLSRFDGCWRWHGDVPDSPWYPSLRQYRQKADGDWSWPLETMTRDLQRFVVSARKRVA